MAVSVTRPSPVYSGLNLRINWDKCAGLNLISSRLLNNFVILIITLVVVTQGVHTDSKYKIIQ